MSKQQNNESIYHAQVLESVNYPSPFLQTMVWYVWVIGLLLFVSGLFPAVRQAQWLALLPGAAMLLPSSLIIWRFAWRRDGKRVTVQCPLCTKETEFIVPSLRAIEGASHVAKCQHCPVQLTFVNARVICYHRQA